MAIDLYPHQTAALNEMRNGCILKGDVGSGKSITALAYYFIKECGGSLKLNGVGDYAEMETSKDLLIITPGKKRDDKEWEKECVPFNLRNERDISFDGVKVTIDSWQNIQKYVDVKDHFVIFDEQRLVGSGAWVKAFYKIAKNNRWIVLSATPGDHWFDYLPIMVANGYYKNRTDFIQQHVVWKPFSKFPKVDRYVDVGRLYKIRKEIIINMPDKRHTKRHIHQTMVPHDKELMEKVIKKRWHVYEERPIKDAGELFQVMRKVVNTDKSRIDEVHKLFDKHPRLIIFYNFKYELESLRTLEASLGVPVAEWNGEKHEAIPEGNSWIYLVQYTAGAEGWNCITTDATVFFSLNYSYKINEQARGRIDRMNTKYTDLYYYVIRSGAMIDQQIWKAITLKQNFNEKEYAF